MTTFNIEAGKRYKLKHPESCGQIDIIHIDYILDNPIKSKADNRLVVYRHYTGFSGRWWHYVCAYHTLAYYNGYRSKKNQDGKIKYLSNKS